MCFRYSSVSEDEGSAAAETLALGSLDSASSISPVFAFFAGGSPNFSALWGLLMFLNLFLSFFFHES